MERNTSVKVRLRAAAVFTVACGLLNACSGTTSPAPSVAAPASASAPAPSEAASASASVASPSASAAAAGQTIDEVCAKGVQEGQLDYQAGFNTDAFPKYNAEFQKAYPGITINYSQADPEDTVRRIITEAQSGRTTLDLTYSDPNIAQELVDADLVDKSFDWKSLGVPAGAVVQDFMVRVYRTAFGLVYNTNLVKPEDLPNTWDEVINPKWSGKVVAHLHADSLRNLALVWGIDKLTTWANAFKSTDNPVVIDGATAGMQTVASGENEFTTAGRDDSFNELSSKNAPLGIKYLDIIPTAEPYHTVVKGAHHPNAAACWVAWLASPAGLAAQKAIDFKTNFDIPQGSPAGATLASINTAADAKLVADAGDKVAKILTP
jgi:iron(III) transport system substrate-binding protein